MALTKAFYEAVQAGNVNRVRIMMEDSLLVDPTFGEFDAMAKAAASMPGLYDQHDGKELVEDQTCWNDDYMDKVMVAALSNFSHERIDHLKSVVHYLRPAARATAHKLKPSAAQRSKTAAPPLSYQEEKRRSQEQGDYLGAKISVGAVAGAAVGGVITTAAGASTACVVGSVLTGAVIGGIAVAVINHGGNR